MSGRTRQSVQRQSLHPHGRRPVLGAISQERLNLPGAILHRWGQVLDRHERRRERLGRQDNQLVTGLSAQDGTVSASRADNPAIR